MKVMLTPDEVVAKLWDDYLHRFGAEEYVMARYLTPPTRTPMNVEALDDLPAGGFLLTTLIRFAQHPDEHRPKRPILLAVDQELGEGAALAVTSELAAARLRRAGAPQARQ